MKKILCFMYLSNRRANMEMGLNLEYAKFWDRLFFLHIKINQIIKKQKLFLLFLIIWVFWFNTKRNNVLYDHLIRQPLRIRKSNKEVGFNLKYATFWVGCIWNRIFFYINLNQIIKVFNLLWIFDFFLFNTKRYSVFFVVI